MFTQSDSGERLDVDTAVDAIWVFFPVVSKLDFVVSHSADKHCKSYTALK